MTDATAAVVKWPSPDASRISESPAEHTVASTAWARLSGGLGGLLCLGIYAHCCNTRSRHESLDLCFLAYISSYEERHL